MEPGLSEFFRLQRADLFGIKVLELGGYTSIKNLWPESETRFRLKPL
jgi:hypothetical protein